MKKKICSQTFLLSLTVLLGVLLNTAGCSSKTKAPSTDTTTSAAATASASNATVATTAATPPKAAAATANTSDSDTKPKIANKTVKSEATSAAQVTCKSASEERKLIIQPKETGCELQYTKAGETKTIASQITGNAKCEEVLNTVKQKLVAANFKCE